jgi:hypothetical protein
MEGKEKIALLPQVAGLASLLVPPDLPRDGDRVLSMVDSWKGYGKAEGKRLRLWRPGTAAKPKDLRRTAPTHARKNRIA